MGRPSTRQIAEAIVQTARGGESDAGPCLGPARACGVYLVNFGHLDTAGGHESAAPPTRRC
jgi:hypothetical protein